jgi:hypothetical protein
MSLLLADVGPQNAVLSTTYVDVFVYVNGSSTSTSAARNAFCDTSGCVAYTNSASALFPALTASPNDTDTGFTTSNIVSGSTSTIGLLLGVTDCSIPGAKIPGGIIEAYVPAATIQSASMTGGAVVPCTGTTQGLGVTASGRIALLITMTGSNIASGTTTHLFAVRTAYRSSSV